MTESARPYVVVDIETTGLKPPECRIIEIAAIRVEEGRLAGTFHTLVNPGVRIPWFITNLTGINNSMVEEAPFFRDIAVDLLNFIGAAVIVAHNAGFDYKFIKSELENAIDDFVLENEKLCTVRLARKKYPHLGKYNLDFLTEHFNLSNDQRHRALGDAMVTFRLFSEHLYPECAVTP